MVLPKATSFRPKWSRRQPLRSQPPRGATPDQSQDQQQDDRTHESDEDGRDHAVKRRCDMGRAEDQPAEERSDDSDDDVAAHAQTAAHDSRCQPTRDEPDNQPDQESFCAHDFLRAASVGTNWRLAKSSRRKRARSVVALSNERATLGDLTHVAYFDRPRRSNGRGPRGTWGNHYTEHGGPPTKAMPSSRY